MAASKSSSSSKKDEDPIKVSSGYTQSEIENILSNAEAVFKASTNDALLGTPKHKKAYFDVSTDKRTCKSSKYEDYVYFEVNGQPLRVALEFSAERDTELVTTRLHSGFSKETSKAVNHLYFKGDAGIKFEITAFIDINDEYVGDKVGDLINYENRTVFPVLDDWVRTNTVCKVVTFSPLIENGYYRIEKLKPTQVDADNISCDISFVQDTYNYERPLATRQPGSSMNEVIGGKGVARTELVAGGTVPKYTGLAKQLYDCGELSKLCTCTTKKTSSCVTTYKSCTYVLQQCLRKVGLYFDGRIDGLFCYITYNAVIQYQQRHKDKLNVTGKMDTKTKLLLCDEVQNGR